MHKVRSLGKKKGGNRVRPVRVPAEVVATSGFTVSEPPCPRPPPSLQNLKALKEGGGESVRLHEQVARWALS